MRVLAEKTVDSIVTSANLIFKMNLNEEIPNDETALLNTIVGVNPFHDIALVASLDEYDQQDTLQIEQSNENLILIGNDKTLVYNVELESPTKQASLKLTDAHDKQIRLRMTQ
jgi:hypothetical protein